MKKILFVIDSLNCGGAEKSLVSLLPLMSPEKYEIHLWMLNRGGVFESLLPDHVIIESEPIYDFIDKIKYHIAHVLYSTSFRLNHFLNKQEHTAETFWKCMGWAYKIPNQQYDVAIAYQQGLPTYLVATKIHARKKIAWINADIFAAGYNILFNAMFYNRYDAIVSVSQTLKSLLIQNYPDYTSKFHCVQDILNPDIIKKQAQEPIGEKIFLDSQVRIVTTGRLATPKNYILAVESAYLLREKGIDFKWFFIGEGSERAKIEDLIDKYNLHDIVILLGMRTNPYPYMANSTIYVQTSSFEGFGITIAEAKILGKPVVSTNFDVVHDQIKHEQNGLIADMTPESVADNIHRLLNDNSLQTTIVDNVRKDNNTTYLTEVKKVEQLLNAD